MDECFELLTCGNQILYIHDDDKSFAQNQQTLGLV